jgi:hypothetical protein
MKTAYRLGRLAQEGPRVQLVQLVLSVLLVPSAP